MYNITNVRLDQGFQTMARGPNLACKDRMGQFGAAGSGMKYEMCFPLECHQSAEVHTAIIWEVCKRKSQSNDLIFPIMLYLL